jgi:hypothetical protein
MVLASGCGGSGGTSPTDRDDATTSPVDPAPDPAGDVAAEAPDPCALVTADEVATRVGFEAFAEGPDEVNEGTSCVWFFSDPSDPTEMGTLSIQVWVGLEYYGPETNQDAAADFEPVPGIGDAAHRWDLGAATDCAIVFRKEDVVVQLVSLFAVEDLCIDLAGVAAGRV